MKFSLKRALCFVIVAAMLLCAVPAAFAETSTTEGNDNKSVLKSISYTVDGKKKTVTLSGDSRDVTLTVPYSHSGSITLSSDSLTYDSSSDYGSKVADMSGSVSVESPMKLVIQYELASDSSGSLYKTEYTVKVQKDEKVEPTFSGDMSKNATVGEALTFSEADFSKFYKKNDGQGLYGIKITGSNPSWGKFKLGNSDYSVGASSAQIIPVEDLSKLSFVATATSSSSIDYFVTGYDSEAQSVSIGRVTLTISASEPVEPSANTINYNVKVNAVQKLDAGSFVNALPGNYLQSGESLSHIAFTSSPSCGTLYYGYSSASSLGSTVSRNTNYYVSGSSSLISNITYVPSKTGTDKIEYTAYTSSNRQIKGIISITVSTNSVNNITYNANAGSAVKFSASDFASVCTAFDSSKTLSYVKFTVPSTTYGTFRYNYTSSSSTGSAVTSSTMLYNTTGTTTSLSKVAFIPKSTLSSTTVTINYSAYASNGTKLYDGKVLISVSGSSADKTVKYSCKKNGSVTFSASSFKYNSTSPSYIIFDDTPLSTEGYLYHGSTSSTSNRIDSSDEGSTKYYYSSSKTKYISNIKFVPKSSFTGDVEIPFTAYDSSNDEIYSGRILIEVGSSSSSGDVDVIEYEVAANDYVTFTTSDFNKVCKDEYDVNLDYVEFELPDKDEGKLYYKYDTSSESSVSSSKKYYRSKSPQISEISFVPDKDFDGTVIIYYTGVTVDDDEFDGEIEITVEEADSSVITYNVSNGSYVKFKSGDFDDASNDINDEDLNYIKLKSVTSSYGKLYYNYSSSSSSNTQASTSTSYYVSGSGKSLISNLTFVPSTTSSTTVSFKYTGYDKDGDTFDGTIKIKINSGADDEDEDDVITYTVKNTSSVKFNASDFNNVSKALNDETLDYVKFTLPSSTYGKLYVNYSSDTSPGTLVTANAKYYRSGTSPLISDISFVPSRTYTGTLYINFAGYDEEGESLSGTVKIKVTSDTTPTTASKISYKTDTKTPVPFVANDFNTACYSATNKTLSYVTFSLPSSSYGTLYVNYASSTSTGTAVTAGTKYYYTSTSPLISAVTFVPKDSYTGTVTINYTGYATDGTSYTGTIDITVSKASEKTASAYFKDVGSSLSWAATGVDYLYEKGIVTGTSSGVYSPTNNIKRGDFILMLQRAFKFSANANEKQFGDVPSTSYYASAILAAKSNNIALGGGDNKFRPEETLTREDAMVLVIRALEAAGEVPTKGSSSDIASFSDKDSISGYATEAIATLVKAGYVNGSSGKLSPKSNITRAEMAVLLYRILTK